MPDIIFSGLQTPDGTMITSTHRHDYVTHLDANGKEYMLDGGLDYIRSSAHGDEVYKTLFDDEPHAIQRQILTWGTYGKDGNQPLSRKPIELMSTEHIQAVLHECNPMTALKNCMLKELKERGVDYDA